MSKNENACWFTCIFRIQKDGNVDLNEGEKERRTEIRQMVKYALFKCNHGVTLGFYTNTKGTEHLHEHGWVNNSYITAYKAFILAFWNVPSIRHSLNSRERVFSLYRFLVLESNPRVLSIKERKIREETTWRNNGKVRESHDQRKEKEGLKRKWKKMVNA